MQIVRTFSGRSTSLDWIIRSTLQRLVDPKRTNLFALHELFSGPLWNILQHESQCDPEYVLSRLFGNEEDTRRLSVSRSLVTESLRHGADRQESRSTTLDVKHLFGPGTQEVPPLIPSGERVAIIGRGGAGKTFAAAEIHYQLTLRARSDANAPLPVSVNMKSLIRKFDDGQIRLPEPDELGSIVAKFSEESVSPQLHLLKNVVFLVDGMDEVNPTDLGKWLDLSLKPGSPLSEHYSREREWRWLFFCRDSLIQTIPSLAESSFEREEFFSRLLRLEPIPLRAAKEYLHNILDQSSKSDQMLPMPGSQYYGLMEQGLTLHLLACYWREHGKDSGHIEGGRRSLFAFIADRLLAQPKGFGINEQFACNYLHQGEAAGAPEDVVSIDWDKPNVRWGRRLEVYILGTACLLAELEGQGQQPLTTTAISQALRVFLESLSGRQETLPGFWPWRTGSDGEDRLGYRKGKPGQDVLKKLANGLIKSPLLRPTENNGFRFLHEDFRFFAIAEVIDSEAGRLFLEAWLSAREASPLPHVYPDFLTFVIEPSEEDEIESRFIRELSNWPPASRRFLELSLAGNPLTPITTLRGLAAAQDASSELLEVLGKHSREDIRILVAKNPSTPSHVLGDLIRDAYELVRGWAAEHPSTPADLLDICRRLGASNALSEFTNPIDESISVVELERFLIGCQWSQARGQIAIHPNTSKEMMRLLATDLSWGVRSNLSLNSRLPLEMFIELAKDSTVRDCLAQNPNLPPSFMQELLFDSNPSVRIAVAQNSALPAALLHKLALDDDPNVRIALAKNRSLAPETLFELAQSAELLGAPDSERMLMNLAKHPNLPHLLVTTFLDHHNCWVRSHLAANSTLSRFALERLSNDSNCWARFGLARNPSLPQHLFFKLMADPEERVRFALSTNPSLPLQVLKMLVNDTSEMVRQEAQRHPSLSVSFRPHLAHRKLDSKIELRSGEMKIPDNDPICQRLIDNPNLSLDLLCRLSPIDWILQKLAMGDPIGLEWVGRIINDQNVWVQRYFARRCTPCHLELTEEVILWMANNENFNSLLGAIPSLTESIMKQLSSHDDWVTRWTLAKNPQLPSILMDKLARDSNRAVRASLAENANLPLHIMHDLAIDVDHWVRWTVSQHPKLPYSLMEQIAMDDVLYTNCGLASNPSLPLTIMEKIFSSSDHEVRAVFAANPILPTFMMEELVHDSSASVRSGIFTLTSYPWVMHSAGLVNNPRLSHSVIRQLADDPDLNVRIKVAHHKGMVGNLVERFAESHNSSIRQGVAKNLLLSHYCMVKYLNDVLPVRASLAENPALPLPIMRILVADVQEVRESLALNPALPEDLMWELSGYTRE